mmetsp:Transcript_37404/g.70227  ORF Transcript_37404/g.70227 Transcript_37404/m.70227 type:complete len:297 (+) Transcript_37404:61-951(+)
MISPRISGDEWDEYFDTHQGGRPYYHNKETSNTQWEEPTLHFETRLRLAADELHVPLEFLKELSLWVDGRHDSLLASSTVEMEGYGLSSVSKTVKRLLENIVTSPSQPKYRTLRKQNPSFSKVWNMPTARGTLLQIGFVEQEHDVTLPMHADLGPARFVSARLNQAQAAMDLATTAQPSGDSHGLNSRWHQNCHHCASCEKMINDGTERVWTGRHDAPRGEFRYKCNQCSNYSLCETCWDLLQGGKMTHESEHTFEHIHPITTRHNTTITGQGPWGNFSGSVSGRSRERLRERSGL